VLSLKNSVYVQWAAVKSTALVCIL
jgi:hypothetical protein